IENVYECLKQQHVHDKTQEHLGFTLPYDHKAEGIVWMQFTGLHDKNGKEIYEGDVIMISAGHQSWICDPFEVVFMNGAFQMKKPDKAGATSFAIYLHDCLLRGMTTDDSNDSHLFEVIGNIYQNPELLKQ